MKNIVILSDGTGQTFRNTESNVLRLYEFLLKDPAHQIAIYDPGIATSPVPLGMNPAKHIRHLRELGWGVGLLDKVAELYRFLMLRYDPGDRIYFFGFSRGAFTVRALGALIHVCGLLRPEDVHLLPDAIELFRTSESRIRKGGKHNDELEGGPIDHAKLDPLAVRFKKTFAMECQIDFLGIWDTVKGYGFFRPRSFPCLRHNPGVRLVRHAVSLDEKRSHFQMTGWGDRDDKIEKVKEVWFRGDHSDVGGGHDDGNNRLTDITLAWMLGEATQHGLLLDENQRAEIEKVSGIRSGPMPAARNLNRGLQRILSRCPRPELDNRCYPPPRPIRLRPSAERKPIDHVEGGCVRFHVSVPEAEGRPGNIPAECVCDESTTDVYWPPCAKAESMTANG